MSAEILRRAAAVMRERAEAATEGPWVHLVEQEYDEDGPTGHEAPTRCWSTPDAASEDVWFEADTPKDAEHITSWHPGVSPFAAALLDAIADGVDEVTSAFGAALVDRRSLLDGVLGYDEAVAFARAYLGEPATLPPYTPPTTCGECGDPLAGGQRGYHPDCYRIRDGA